MSVAVAQGKAGRLTGLGAAIAVVAIIADQLVKNWLLLGPMREPQLFEITPFFNVVSAWNKGVSFSLLWMPSQYGPWILSGVAIAISLGLAVWLTRVSQLVTAIGIGLVIGGALGNVIDRIRFGAVFDFLDFYVGTYHWPAFNVADSCICVGVVLLLWDGLFHGQERGKS
ncbi:MAG TPA: signal peptidase II [Terriglobales bacterium]|nr:signal peptidase II [Terriglobales bacterium]